MSVEPAATRLRHQVPLVIWLVLVWILLWGTWSWANVISGLLVALAVLVFLPLPHVVGGVRVRPVPLLVFFGHFAADLLVSAAQVAWIAVRPGGVRQAAIVRVQLRTDSDLILTMVAEATSLVPGSLVLDLDREERLITVHLLHVDDEAAVAREKEDVLRTETRLVRAIGSAADLAALEAAA
ncbi:Na+/H+ antiporter subunit E [Geodermatophilus sabuli]|uniref:Multisubunit sodium/proton antiporter, MrpE subunit n=1 Tax=Geodermatophilus sabuli TaxID=1564158 RepID=A0A285ECJ2_9ACTN|nr:Na+/H+ antiporter subunit E [Geodermatophilus sabuli]MBB3083534.1 multicomponent Na+:H+ antiporter subunit E [Geodermatophilus sabuli]SNX96745.1 multisubunit sodium/proton antiporter, MrpE subunit [Geodermatophilus sabuli]